ncbi:hypothetical protein ES708_25969 [subsurface metagenome]
MVAAHAPVGSFTSLNMFLMSSGSSLSSSTLSINPLSISEPLVSSLSSIANTKFTSLSSNQSVVEFMIALKKLISVLPSLAPRVSPLKNGGSIFLCLSCRSLFLGSGIIVSHLPIFL